MKNTIPPAPALPRGRIKALVHDPARSARAVDLLHVNDQGPGIVRVKRGPSFTYRWNGRRVTDPATLARIRALAIPPAWTDVWICPKDNGHLQATGKDVKGRKQYRYHKDWSAVRSSTKFFHALEFGTRLPAIRARLAHDLALPGTPREKVLATVVSIMEQTQIRVGNEAYAKENGSYGLSTMKDRHVQPTKDGVRFVFRGKTGLQHDIRLRSRRLAKLVMRCKDLPGQDLFQYIDEQGEVHPIDSGMINAYISDIAGGTFTSKDFRTWMGTVHCVRALAELGAEAKKARSRADINSALDQVARQLGNTRAVCRKYYVHPQVLAAHERNELQRHVTHARRTTRTVVEGPLDGWEERVVMAVLKAG